MVFICIHIRRAGIGHWQARTARATVTRMKYSCREVVSSYQTIITAAAAAIAFTAVVKSRQCHGIYQCRFLLTAVVRQQRSAKGTHQPCNIRSDDFFACQLFHSTQNGIAVEGTSLHDDCITQIACVTQTNNFIKRIFNNGNSQPGCNIANGRTVLLRLFYFRIHKNSTTYA